MMSPYYQEIPVGMDEEILIVLGVLLLFLGAVLLFAMVGWILSSMSLHAIARRRGIAHAWLAWIPIGNMWMLGSVSDQYEHLVQGKVTSRRKVLLILEVAGFLIGMVYVVLSAVIGIVDEADVLLPTTFLFSYLVMLGASITMMVFYHICNYDLYRSCDPNNAVTFLVLGIIIPVCQPFFYLACRKKDLGFVVPAPVIPEPTQLPRIGPEF